MYNPVYIPAGTDKVKHILNGKSKFLVYYDPDPDGLIAGYLAEEFLALFGIHAEHYINRNRQHGFFLENPERYKGYTIIAVDFYIAPEKVIELTNMGINIINIDHHEIGVNELFYYESLIAHSVIINNQYSFEPEDYRFASGAAMVYYVFSALSEKFRTNMDYVALMGISLLTDIRPIKNKEANQILNLLYTHKSPLVSRLINATKNATDFSFGVQIFLDRNYIDFTLSPKINALFRLDKGETAIELIKGNFNDSVYLDSLRKIQNTAVSSIVKPPDGSDPNGKVFKSFVFRFVYDDLDIGAPAPIENFIGVACSRVKDAEEKTTLFCVLDRKTGKVKRGSIRGAFDSVDYLEIFKKHGFVCAGHKYAAGVLSHSGAVDFDSIDAMIGSQEVYAKETEYNGRIIDMMNLSIFSGKNREIAEANNFLRSSERLYIRYTGKNHYRTVMGKMVLYKIDGVDVKCFDFELTPETGLILPITEKGYISFVLSRKDTVRIKNNAIHAQELQEEDMSYAEF